MVTIPSDVQRMMRKEQVIVVGTANQKGIPNVSPRSSFYVDYNAIYWYEIFKHKSYQNYMTNNWVSVAIFDYPQLLGYQLKGNIEIVTDKDTYYYANTRISKNLPPSHREKIQKLVNENDVKIIKFTPVAIYSLNPVDFEKVPGLLDADTTVDAVLESNSSMYDY